MNGTPGPTAAQGNGKIGTGYEETTRMAYPPTHPGIASSRDVRCSRDMEPWTRTEPTILNRGNPAQTGRRLGQGERSPSNKPYLQRVTEWTGKGNGKRVQYRGGAPGATRTRGRKITRRSQLRPLHHPRGSGTAFQSSRASARARANSAGRALPPAAPRGRAGMHAPIAGARRAVRRRGSRAARTRSR